MAENIFNKGFYGLGGGGIETPFEAGVKGAQGVQNIFARQMELNNARQEQQAVNALQNEMGGMDMQNPDYAKIFSLAPEFGLKFMNGMAQLNEQQRLSAVNHFKIGQDIIERALPIYAMNPTSEMRANISSALQGAKYDQKYIDTILPDRSQFPDDKTFQTAMLASSNINEYIKGLNKQIELGIKRTTEQEKTSGRLKQEGIKQETAKLEGASKERVAQTMAGATLGSAKIRLDTVALQQGHSQEVNLGTDESGTPIGGRAIYDPKKKEINIIPYPKGVTRYEKPTGKGGGAGTTQTKFDQTDVDKYNKIVASGQGNYIAEAQKYMRGKYGRLPGEEIKGGGKTGKASLWD